MKKITMPHKANERRNIFSEEINYFTAGSDSIWGSGHPLTIAALKRTKLKGCWLDLAAGDGRYTPWLLKKADAVVAADIDEGALSKLMFRMPRRLRKKLALKAFDMTKPFPFQSGEFDGVFCAGILHLFQKSILRRVCREILRVLKPTGVVFIVFPADILRVSPDGVPLTFGKEPMYTLAEARQTLKRMFPSVRATTRVSRVASEEYPHANPSYTFSCRFIMFVGRKR